MKLFLTYVFKRFILMLVTIWIGITITFIVSRALPFNAAETLVGMLVASGSGLRTEELEALRKVLLELYGLNKPIFVQYIDFLKNYLTGNMGPSFAYFPTPVSTIIAWALPWSIVLLLTVSILNWIMGTLIGLLAGITKRKRIAEMLEGVALIFLPIPYTVLAIAFIIVYALILKLPLTIYGSPIPPKLSLEFIVSMLERMMLPATSLLIFGWFGNFIAMKNLVIRFQHEDYIIFKVMQGLPKRKITMAVFRNALIPQYTSLVLGLTRVFIGSVVVEHIFNYPGIGLVLRGAIANGDYNLMLGIISLTVVAVGIATFILDLTIPLIDPRIRYPGAG